MKMVSVKSPQPVKIKFVKLNTVTKDKIWNNVVNLYKLSNVCEGKI